MSKYPLSTKSGLITVFASLISSKSSVTLKMALDTGATYTIIPVESAIAIGCDPIKSHKRIEITTGSGVEYVPIVCVPRFKSLGFEVKNLDVVCHDLPPKSPIDGLLGLNFLTQFNVYLKFLEHTLEVTN